MVNSILAKTLLVAGLLFAGLGSNHAMAAEIQDAIWEKFYCLDDDGTEIRFENEEGIYPPKAEKFQKDVRIIGDEGRLKRVRSEASQFLFVRACIAASTIRRGDPEGALECTTSKLLTRRYDFGTHDILRVVSVLGRNPDTRPIARALRTCI